MTDCAYCSSEMLAPICGERLVAGFVAVTCTRQPEHDGPHVACGAHHNIVQWGYDLAAEDSPSHTGND